MKNRTTISLNLGKHIYPQSPDIDLAEIFDDIENDRLVNKRTRCFIPIEDTPSSMANLNPEDIIGGEEVRRKIEQLARHYDEVRKRAIHINTLREKREHKELIAEIMARPLHEDAEHLSHYPTFKHTVEMLLPNNINFEKVDNLPRTMGFSRAHKIMPKR